jgi:ABC-type bacteriocin/lantibiotic exporter with double-glycine peptidase domain
MLPLYSQELSTRCVAACVKMTLAALGLSLTEAEIRSRCSHSNPGMRLNQVAGGLTDLPVKAAYHTDWNIDDLTDAIH